MSSSKVLKKPQTPTQRKPRRKKDCNVYESFMKDEDDGDILAHRERGKYQKKSAAAGFREDATKLIKAFAEHSTLEFTHFGKLWQEGGYSLLYMNRENERELSELAYEMFAITLSFLVNKDLDITMRMGAVYLLYFLYKEQPFPKLKVKIRILPEDCEQLHNIMEIAKQSKINHCMYVILDLIYSEAFDVVGSRYLMGPESSESRNQFDKPEEIVLEPTCSTEMQKLLDTKIFQRINNIEEKLKALQIDLNLEDELPDYSETTGLALKIIEMAARGDEGVFDLLEDEAKLEPDATIGHRRVHLKEQQLKAKCKSPMSRRHRKYLKTSIKEEFVDDEIDIDDPINLSEQVVPDIKKEIKEEVISDEEFDSEKKFEDHEKYLLELGIVIEKTNADATARRKSPRLKNYKPSSSQSQTDNETNDQLDNNENDSDFQHTASKKGKNRKSRSTKSNGSPIKAEVLSPKKSSSPKKALKSPLKSPRKKSNDVLKRFVRKSSWRKARILGSSRPEKKIMKGKKIKYYDDSEDDDSEDSDEVELKKVCKKENKFKTDKKKDEDVDDEEKEDEEDVKIIEDEDTDEEEDDV